VDFAISGISVSASRLEAVDFTFPYWNEPSAVALKLRSNKWTYFTDPLQTNLWLIFLSLPLLLAAVVVLLDNIHASITTEKSEEYQLAASFHHYSFQFTRCIFNQGVWCVGGDVRSLTLNEFSGL
jgi:hypothetical protein